MFDPVKYLEGTNPESSITDAEVRFLFELALKHFPLSGVILELGVHHGRSACLLAYIACIFKGQYIGIDHFECERSSQAEAQGYLDERGLRDASIIAESTEAVLWDTPVDFLHIDAGHYEPDISADAHKFVPLVKREGIVAFDDYEPDYADIMKNADLLCHNENWQDLGCVDGMKCWKRIS